MSDRQWPKEISQQYMRDLLSRSVNEIDRLTAKVAELEKALTDIADMPEHDQDDAHRLRHKANFALSDTKQEE